MLNVLQKTKSIIYQQQKFLLSDRFCFLQLVLCESKHLLSTLEINRLYSCPATHRRIYFLLHSSFWQHIEVLKNSASDAIYITYRSNSCMTSASPHRTKSFQGLHIDCGPEMAVHERFPVFVLQACKIQINLCSMCEMRVGCSRTPPAHTQLTLTKQLVTP